MPRRLTVSQRHVRAGVGPRSQVLCEEVAQVRRLHATGIDHDVERGDGARFDGASFDPVRFCVARHGALHCCCSAKACRVPAVGVEQLSSSSGADVRLTINELDRVKALVARMRGETVVMGG